ncbi:hypothetical protein BT96DRAFT_959082 [Gymnopus androsaceus JB14]|uniref:CxC2-like cysteine cluster KDZ transposase-associated domain-containing protein n=1 Tax=Gymnopus androsaceus JB14 TaxID=1447944 RepID=A0A6A4H6M4_9AGAR|nr:hypothetical protein BT96DRAFT_959082 [Gymnopus androsaceus JB14]
MKAVDGSGYFIKVSLHSLGLRYQLGHIPGEYCTAPKAGHTNFMVIDNDALHTVAIDYCECLLEIGWWPSTAHEPQTVATFNALQRFHVINLRGHLSPTDYYRAIEELTDGTGLHRPSFMLILCQWRNIKGFKRFGRGHDPTGIRGTIPRSLIVPCRPCPHPGINLPGNWREDSPSKSWLYSLFIGQDACFKQKACQWKHDDNDLQLSNGLGLFVDQAKYSTFLASSKDQNEVGKATMVSIACTLIDN